MTPYEPSIEDLTTLIDDELVAFLTRKRDTLEEAGPMIDEIDRLVRAGGKRLRPLFCYWGFRAAGGSHEPAIVAAASSLELLHTFAIVHDDIMDRSSERRGLPTTFAAHGTDVALLVGDLALVLADAALMESGFPSEVLSDAFGHYSRMRQEVIAGQFMDVVAARSSEMSVDAARRIAVLKSGRYSIQEPLVIGAALAGGDHRTLSAFGEPLGEAFQLRDDLLGTFGDPAAVGKPVDSDIREGKRHVLYAYALERLGAGERDRFVQLWGGGDRLSPDEVAWLSDALVSCGARTATEGLLEDLRAEAAARLSEVGCDDESRAALAELARRATERTQ